RSPTSTWIGSTRHSAARKPSCSRSRSARGNGDTMTDDQWRQRGDERRRRGDDDFSEYGSLFDDAEPTENLSEVRRDAGDTGDTGDRGDTGGSISFGDDESGPLPHWTEPPTGEIPRPVRDEV